VIELPKTITGKIRRVELREKEKANNRISAGETKAASAETSALLVSYSLKPRIALSLA
jgi:hypothetical protein